MSKKKKQEKETRSCEDFGQQDMTRRNFFRSFAPKKLPLTGIKVSEECTACGACERICPYGAIRIVKKEEEFFKLIFYPANCTVCDLCKTACYPQSLQFYPLAVSPGLRELEPVTLLSGVLRSCKRCGTGFHSTEDITHCPTCEFRAKNPFGSIHIPS